MSKRNAFINETKESDALKALRLKSGLSNKSFFSPVLIFIKLHTREKIQMRARFLMRIKCK